MQSSIRDVRYTVLMATILQKNMKHGRKNFFRLLMETEILQTAVHGGK
jgi:hypothetical protein